MKLNKLNFTISLTPFKNIWEFILKYEFIILFLILSVISALNFVKFYENKLGLAYNDARSHLDIGRRVVEGLKPGIAQLGSVWLPLPHILMTITIWNDFMWHSGLAGAIVSMISFVITGMLIYSFLKRLNVGMLGRIVGVFVFVTNLNVLYLQSTAMTELLLLATMTLSAYEFVLWHQDDKILHLVKAAFWVMLATLTRYDGWFLMAWEGVLVILHSFSKKEKDKTEGLVILFGTLAGFGIFLWLLWNLLIFKDPLYFALGPYSAKAQQDQLVAAGVLQTKHNLWLSLKFYFFALVYNTGAFPLLVGFIGSIALWLEKKVSLKVRIATSVLIAPFVFNVIALYFGHSVLFIQGLSGDTWFNVRYGIMMIPSVAVFVGFLVDRVKELKYTLIGLLLFITFFNFSSADTVTIDDARVGSSQKNVTEVSGWLNEHAKNEKGFILISAASHDAIIFSSGLPMSRFIHEGTGLYWKEATIMPDRWARWIILRTYDDSDGTYKLIKNTEGFKRYNLIHSFPFADIYEIKPEYLDQLHYTPDLGPQR